MNQIENKIPCEDWKHIADERYPPIMVYGLGGYVQKTSKICNYQWREDILGFYETVIPNRIASEQDENLDNENKEQ